MDPCPVSDPIQKRNAKMNGTLEDKKSRKTLLKNGILFFSKEAERKFFFVLTMIMLIMGLIYKWI